MKSKYIRAEEAKDRQKAYNALSTEQKLKLIASRRGKSKRERAKLKGQQNDGNTGSKATQKGKRVKKG